MFEDVFNEYQAACNRYKNAMEGDVVAQSILEMTNDFLRDLQLSSQECGMLMANVAHAKDRIENLAKKTGSQYQECKTGAGRMMNAKAGAFGFCEADKVFEKEYRNLFCRELLKEMDLALVEQSAVTKAIYGFWGSKYAPIRTYLNDFVRLKDARDRYKKFRFFLQKCG